jgi:hypothetical protein
MLSHHTMKMPPTPPNKNARQMKMGAQCVVLAIVCECTLVISGIGELESGRHNW